MTEQAFITLHSSNIVGNINYPNRININYDATGPGTGKITGVSITNRALPLSTTPELGSTLAKATSIRFKIDNIPFILSIRSRSRIQSPPGSNAYDFYYYRVTPVDFTITDADRVVEPIFHTGITELPEYREVRSSYKLAATITAFDTEISYTYGYNEGTGSIEVGNIIRIQNTSNAVGQNDEYMRVKKIFPNSLKMEVEREYVGAGAASGHTANDLIFVVQPVNLYQFDETGVNFLTVANSQVWIKDSQEILKTDIYGVVYTSSSCQV